MVLSKRERVIRTLERDDEPDIIPIQTLGFERTGSSYQEYLESDEYKENETTIKNNYSKEDFRWAGNITELRFWKFLTRMATSVTSGSAMRSRARASSICIYPSFP